MDNSPRRLGASDLARLDRIARLLNGQKGRVNRAGAQGLLFSLKGFYAELSAAPRRGLIEPARLYEGS